MKTIQVIVRIGGRDYPCEVEGLGEILLTREARLALPLPCRADMFSIILAQLPLHGPAIEIDVGFKEAT